PPHRRLSTLLAACEGADAVAADTLGMRNQRLLRLHRDLVGGVLEARGTCAHCATESGVELPAEAILGAPPRVPDARVRVRYGGRTVTVRLPRIADIEIVSAPDLRRAIIERCRTGTGRPVPADLAEKLGRKFEALDPAANIVVNIACSGCTRPI